MSNNGAERIPVLTEQSLLCRLICLQSFFACIVRGFLSPHLLFWRCVPIKTKELLMNDAIREKEVRVVDADGSQLGIMQTKDALKLAVDKGLDLVKIAPQAVPPVCRIMDYGKYNFEKQKREKEQRKNQKTVEVKEVQLSCKIEDNDIKTKSNHARRFLATSCSNVSRRWWKTRALWRSRRSWRAGTWSCSSPKSRLNKQVQEYYYRLRGEPQHAKAENAQRCEKEIQTHKER